MLTGACFISGRYNALSLYNSAAWPAQMFTMFGGGEMDAGSGLGYANPLINGMTGEMPLSLGTVLGLGAGLFLLALLDPAVRGADRGGLRLGGWALGFGALCVYLASDLFPWYALSLRQDPLSQALSSLLGKLQYVWRFLAPATVLLVLATCCGLLLYKAKRPDWARLAGAAALLLTVIPAGYLLYETCTTSPVLNYMSLGSFGIKEDQVAGGEYMPYDLPDDGTTDYDGLELSAPEGVATADVVRGALSVQFTAENTTGSEATVLLPLYAYPGYALTDTGSGAVLGRQQGYLAVTLPAGYSGTVTVRFAGFWFWRAADLVSLACILACTGVYIRRRRAAVSPVKVTRSRAFRAVGSGIFRRAPPRRRVCLAKATVFAGLAQALSSNRQLQFGVRTRIIWSYSKGAAIKFAALFCLSARGGRRERSTGLWQQPLWRSTAARCSTNTKCVNACPVRPTRA